MLKLEYRRGDLFANLKDDAIHLHACNSQNKWGAGVAVLFRKIFPKSYIEHCSRNNKVGDGYVLSEDTFKVGCLITSTYYGQKKDPPRKILVNTYMALISLFNSIEGDIVIQSPKINSGKFDVPWELTEKIIERACAKVGREVSWTVWEL